MSSKFVKEALLKAIEEDPDKLPENEVYYQWKEYVKEGDMTLVTPRADPMEYEFSIDFMFTSPPAAALMLKDWGIPYDEYKNWVLVKVLEEPVVWAKEYGIWCEDCGEHFEGGEGNYPDVAYDQHTCKEEES